VGRRRRAPRSAGAEVRSRAPSVWAVARARRRRFRVCVAAL